jgi:hypothetical protein
MTRKFIAPTCLREKIRNPNIEIRNKRKELNSNHEIQNGPVWNIEDLVLVIRICFGFRVSSFFSASHSLAPFASLREASFFRFRKSNPSEKFQISLARFPTPFLPMVAPSS